MIEFTEKETNPQADADIVTSVTFGKELHAGHLLLLATADLARIGLGSFRPVSIINNNSGPRAAGALVKLSEELNLELEETAWVLSNKMISPEQIVVAYRCRIEQGEKTEQALRLLDQGCYDIFAGMAGIVDQKLKQAGFDIEIIPESDYFELSDQLVKKINPVWGGSGFCFLPSEKNLRLLQKGGQLTATGKGTLSLAGLTGIFEKPEQEKLVVFVDGSGDTLDAVASYASLTEKNKAFQLPGTGVGFGGLIASGSKGEALTLTELLSEYENKNPVGSLARALKQLILTRPMVLPNVGNINLKTIIYDFKDNDSLIKTILSCDIEVGKFEQEMEAIREKLREKITSKTSVLDSKTETWIKFLPQKAEALLKTTPETFLGSMNRVKNIINSPEFNNFESIIKQFIKGEGASRFIYESLEEGINQVSDMVGLLKKAGYNLPRTLVKREYALQSNILDAVKKQGYTEDNAVRKAQEYHLGPKGLVLRQNYFLSQLNGLLKMEAQIDSLAEKDFILFNRMIRFCLERLGYEAN